MTKKKTREARTYYRNLQSEHLPVQIYGNMEHLEEEFSSISFQIHWFLTKLILDDRMPSFLTPDLISNPLICKNINMVGSMVGNAKDR